MDDLKSFLKEKNVPLRRLIVIVLMIVFACVLIFRLFVLQIVRGEEYQSNYNLIAEKKTLIDATRGKIYDRNGELLAYNELSYTVTIEDTYSSDSSVDDPDKALNEELATLITAIEGYGDSITNDFGITENSDGSYAFTKSEGTALQRFRADVFGRARISELQADNRYHINETNASAETIMDFLYGDHMYKISDAYDPHLRYEIAVLRYAIGLNMYQKYVATSVAENVSDETAAYVKENESSLPGVDLKEESIRKYNDGKYFAHLIGYTGRISSDEYTEASRNDDTVTRNDVVGKAGIEQYLNSYLSGKKGSDTLYVDSLGNPIKVTDHVDPKAGNDAYLSLDKNLQEETYNLLENEIAGILVSRIVNQKTVTIPDNTADIQIPIYDAYNALIQNGVIDRNHFDSADASDMEQAVYSAYEAKEASVLAELEAALSGSGTPWNSLSEEDQEYMTYIVTMLSNQGILVSDSIDTKDEVYKAWQAGTASLNQYLSHAAEQGWIDITKLSSSTKYVDTDEIYSLLTASIMDLLPEDSGFVSLVYKYAILQDAITGNELCAILYDQGVLPADQTARDGLASGKTSAFSFLVEKIRTLQITPGQLGLKPCSGSCVIMNVKTGEVLACVTYPGYDNNRLANSVDTDYYNYLNTNTSRPMYNNATQQRTAPGSTFKMLSSTAGLAEGVITTDTRIEDEGIFTKVSNQPRCWYYPASHGNINVSEALRDSCNYFFYEVGWRLAGGNAYNDSTGIEKLKKYADLYGLTEKTGIEAEENASTYATEYPVMAAIGQSDNNITTIALARYVTAVANEGTVYNLSLIDHVSDADGNVVKTFGPTVRNQIDVLNTNQWNAIHSGMEMVVDSLTAFNGFPVKAAGKTGTAEESKKAPDHALFVGYAPADDPQYAIAARIANGYKSGNVAAVSKDILGCCFNVQESVDKAANSEALSLVQGLQGD